MRGIILKCVAGVYDVQCNGEIISAYGAGKFRNKNITPLVGDAVELIEKGTDGFIIDSVYQRKNELIRPPLANVDTLLIVLAVKRPNPDLMLADTLILLCRISDIEPIVCINKSDYDSEFARELCMQFKKSGVKAFALSAAEADGILELKEAIGDGITCFCGQSAVGKSSLTNLLLGKELAETGGLSKKTERGKHTTRVAQLISFGENKWLADTPGFSLLDMPQISPEALKDYYYEFAAYAEQCKFNGCNHIHEPGCRVKEAVENGVLSRERYVRYVDLFNTLNEKWRRRYD